MDKCPVLGTPGLRSVSHDAALRDHLEKAASVVAKKLHVGSWTTFFALGDLTDFAQQANHSEFGRQDQNGNYSLFA